MQKKKDRLEVTTLSWEYQDEWQDGFRQGSYQGEKKRRRPDGSPKRNHFFLLPDHDCEYGGKECGIYVSGIAVHVGSDGNGKCEILHRDYTRSCGEHEIKLLGRCLRALFTNGEKLHVGGGGITQIDFKKKSGEPLTDTAVKVFKKVAGIFFDPREEMSRYVKGPRVVLRSYFWSVDLAGWIGFEDRLALHHDLRPINETRSRHDNKPIELFWWP